MSEPARGPSVLVVDDTIENLRLLASMLGEQGYDIRPVTGGEQALRAARADPPDLILLDINMPEMDGYEVCQRLKEIEHLRDVPVIFLTALSATADKVRAFNTGGVDYITKPFQFEEVLARVKTHIALRQARVELRQNYERLQSLEQLRDNLVHMVVHDMRSPIMVLTARLDFLKTDAADVLAESSMDDLRGATHAAGVLNRMANDLLDVSRLEEGKMPIQRQTCDLVAVATEVRTALAGWERRRPIEVVATGAVGADCDRAMVKRILENLITNAIKHTPAGRPIRISVMAAGDRARVAVADEGSGVPPDARERIFEKFGTAATRKDGTYHSAGLGLAFCKLAVEAHGGAIGVTDGSAGGSVFWFELPVSVSGS